MIKKIFKLLMSFFLIIIILGCATKTTVEKKPADKIAVSTVVSPAIDTKDETVIDKEDTLIERIAIEAESGNMDKALQIYEKENGKDPLLYAILLIKNQRLDEAEAVLSEIIKEDDSNVTALYYSSLIYNIRGDINGEKKVLEKIATIDPDNVDTNISLGRIYAREKSYSKAESYFKNVVSSKGYIEDAVLGYGMVLLAQKKNKEALEQFNTVIENSPDNMFAYVQRSQIKSSDNDFRGAEKDLDEAVRIDSDYIWNYLDRGRARLYGGRYGSAAEDFTKVLSYDDSIFIAYIHRAQANEWMKKDDLALADYKKALEIKSDYRRGFVPYALQLYRSKQWNEAAIYFIKAYNIDKSPEYLLLGAASLISSGEKEMANKLIRENMNKIPKDDLLFHVSRLYIDPHYETIVLNKLKDEEDSFTKMKGMFYIAVYYDTFGKNMLSEKYYTEILDLGFIESLEYRVANWKVQ
ncbi:MAG: tetratricopeptide repeat protein [Spirochaetaceae bacterium]|nr:tetratricopeptide repeat protein [Spirochaetaceae bacterium]